jgi:hypothetical protein
MSWRNKFRLEEKNMLGQGLVGYARLAETLTANPGF